MGLWSYMGPEVGSKFALPSIRTMHALLTRDRKTKLRRYIWFTLSNIVLCGTLCNGKNDQKNYMEINMGACMPIQPSRTSLTARSRSFGESGFEMKANSFSITPLSSTTSFV